MPRSSLLVVLSLAGCISQSPPLPPVRWFDPLPAVATAATSGAELPRVRAAAFLRQEFVVRVGERELAIDSGCRWIAPPEQLVAQTLRGVAGEVVVERFELDVRGEPRAVVALRLEHGDAARQVVGEAAAAGIAPEQFAQAMAGALQRAADLARQ